MFLPPAILLPASLLTILIVANTGAFAQDESKTATRTGDPEAAVRELVGHLGSTSFSERQRATSDLLKLEADAVPELESALATATGETATRLQLILTQLRKRLFDDRLDALGQGLTLETAASLPQWDRFSALAGTDKDALTVFHELLLAERSLFAARLFTPRELPAALESRSSEFSKLCNGRAEDEFPIASCIALMLLGSEPETRLIRATSANISDALDDPRFDRVVTDGVHAEIVTAIASEWLNRPGIAADRPLLFSIRHELPVGRSIAQRIIAAQSRRPDMFLSLMCLARLNDPDDLSLVESLLETTATVWPPRGQSVQRLLPGRNVGGNFSVQTRDVALSVAIHLRDARPDDFGIPVRASDETFFVIDSLGFNDDEARAAALAKYRSQFGIAVEKSE